MHACSHLNKKFLSIVITDGTNDTLRSIESCQNVYRNKEKVRFLIFLKDAQSYTINDRND